jgi:hypothetical protein
MPLVDLTLLRLRRTYSRPELAGLWGYQGWQALARGVVTPSAQSCILLFVTVEKQAFQEQYQNRLEGRVLHWEGPTDHHAEDRMLSAGQTGEEIHVFYRACHHSDFEYLGRARVLQSHIRDDRPSSFKFNLIDL